MNEDNPYRAAGTYCGLSYIPRKADEKLLKVILENQRYPYCLAPRQSGKSSLLVNIANRLDKDFHSIFIDLSVLPTKGLNDFDEFLSFLSLKFQSSLNFVTNTTKNFDLSELVNALIKHTEKRIVIFVDEIDVLLSSNFKDQFFAQVRSIFNERSRNSSLMRIQFVLAGAAQPTQLISTVNMSPFNVGIQIELQNLTKEQVVSAASHLKSKSNVEPTEIGNRIYYYTNGSVYLTQLVLERLWEIGENFGFDKVNTQKVNEIVAQIVEEASNNIHFFNIYNYLQNNRELLQKFNLFKKGKEIDFPSINSLKMIGITDGENPFKNLIYELVFSSSGKLSLTEFSGFINVPFSSKGKGFVGRTGKIDRIWNTLNKGNRAAIGQVISIRGFGGLGKTQLAVEYAHFYRDKYKNGVFWLTADEDISVQLIKIGESLNWISQSDTGFDQAELVRNRFRKLSDCLIIFDNVDDQQAIKDYLPELDYHPHILVTSREEQHGFHPINLDTLSDDEARKLLIQIAGRSPKSEAEEKALENILKELDGLPLAVELVGGYLLRQKATTFNDYFEYLESEPIDRLEDQFPDNRLANRNKSIIRALKISEKLLNETEYLEEILDILAWSGKSSMGYSLLRELIGTDDNFALEDALGVALELHFIKKEENEDRYAIHRLLAKVRQFEKPLTDRKEWHQEIVRRMVNWFRERKDEFKYLKEFEAEIIHLQQWQSQSSGIFPNETVYLTDFEAYPLWHRGNYQESEILLEKALELYQKDQLNDNKLLSNVYNDLGAIKYGLGNFRQSFEFQEKVHLIGQKVFEKRSEDVAKFLNNLGSTYGAIGNHQKALELKQQALEIRRELFGEKHPFVAQSLGNLGSTYGAIGNHQKALELKQQALEIRQELFSEKHPDVATSLNNLGSTYGAIGNHQKALELHQQALEISQELFGEKHPNVATSLNNLGSTYGELGNHPKALELQQQALEIRRELFGEKHPFVAQSLGNLGSTYGAIGDHQKALELQQQALEIYQELFGEKHPNIATSLNNLGNTYGALGDHSKAVEYIEKALQIQQEIFGNQHPDTILYCENLILELVESGYREKAGRLAGEFLSYVPKDSPYRLTFEKYGAPYRKAKQRKKKHRR